MKKKLERGEMFGNEEQKVRNGNGTATAVLESNPETVVEAVEEIPPRPPKPSEDAQPCPGWEKGGYKREKFFFLCQGWGVKGHETCRNCYRFGQGSPILQSVSLETLTLVLENAKRSLEGVADDFKDTKLFKEAWKELGETLDAVQREHESQSRGKEYSPYMRRVENLIPRAFAEEAEFLLSRCESVCAKKNNGSADKVRKAFHNWKAEVRDETKRAEINGEFPRWIFAGQLRYFYKQLSNGFALSTLVESIQQGPLRNDRRNGGNGGWNPNNGWVPRR